MNLGVERVPRQWMSLNGMATVPWSDPLDIKVYRDDPARGMSDEI